MAGEEEDPVIVVEVAVGAGHVLAFDGGAAEFGAELHGVLGAGVAEGFGDVDDALAIEEVPGVADARGGALGIDVDSGHQRSEAGDGAFERIEDTERGVGDIAILGDAGVKEFEEAATEFGDPLSADGFGVLEGGGVGRGKTGGGGGGRVGPAEGFFDLGGGLDIVQAEAVGSGEVVLDGAGAGPGVVEGGKGLLEKTFVAEVSVAGEGLKGGRVGGQQEFAIALDVENVDGDRVDILSGEIAKGNVAGGGVREEFAFEAGDLFGGEGADGGKKVIGEGGVAAGTGLQPLVGDVGDGLAGAGFSEADGDAGGGDGALGEAADEVRALDGGEEEGFVANDATAEGGPGFVTAELRTAGAGAIQEEFVGVELLVLQEVIAGAVVGVGAAAGDEGDVAAAVATGGGAVEGGLHFDHFEGVEGDVDAAAEAAAGVHHVGGVEAVDGHGVIGGAGTVDGGVEGLGAVVGLASGGGGEVHAATGTVWQGGIDAGFGDEEVGDVAGGGGHALDLLGRERHGLGGAVSLEEVGSFDDLDLFGEAAGAEGEFDLRGGAFGEANGGGGFFEAGVGGGELVGGAGDGEESREAFGSGDSGEHAAGGLVAEADGGIGDATGGGVFNRDGQRALGKKSNGK